MKAEQDQTPSRLTALEDAIFKSWEKQRENEKPRGYLGASSIGRPCARELWLGFRHAFIARFPGRMLRLFERGQREEAMFIEELKRLGAEVHEVDEKGRQFRVSFFGGHFAGHMDGAVGHLNIDAIKGWCVAEFKTHNAKSFAKLESNGVRESKPEHYAQMQVYMHGTGMKQALYMAVNKDTDHLYCEVIEYDEAAAKALLDRAEDIIFGKNAPPRISEDPAHWQCRYCNAADVCHGREAPRITCRTCVYSSPTREGSWECTRGHEYGWPCPDHIYHPDLLHGCDVIDIGDGWLRFINAHKLEWTAGNAPERVIDAEGGEGLHSRQVAKLKLWTKRSEKVAPAPPEKTPWE